MCRLEQNAHTLVEVRVLYLICHTIELLSYLVCVHFELRQCVLVFLLKLIDHLAFVILAFFDPVQQAIWVH